MDRRAAQRAIFVVQREYDKIVRRLECVCVELCDQWALDRLACLAGTDEKYLGQGR